MASHFSFPEMTPAQIAEGLHSYDIAPSPNLRAEDIANPQPELLPNVVSLFFTNVVGDSPGEQLGFEAMLVLENPEHHLQAIEIRRIYRKARDFLDSIYFGGLTLRDFLRPHPRRVIDILSALVNFLHFRQEKTPLLHSISQEYSQSEGQLAELSARVSELQKAKEEHAYKEQMEEPVVQQLQADVNTIRQKIQEYNTHQLALRSRAKAADEKKDGLLSKISQADFELVKHSQENSKLLSKIVQSPEKTLVPEFLSMMEQHAMVFLTDLLDATRTSKDAATLSAIRMTLSLDSSLEVKTLEEKKGVRDELKTLEKMAMHKVQEKNNTLEVYTKVGEKLSKHLSKISALHETSTAAKASEKEVKAQKAKISDLSLETKTLRIRAAEWQSKVYETEVRLEAKEKERDQRIGENKQKMTTLRSEVESELKCLADKEREIEEKIAKAADLCSQSDSVEAAGRKKREEIYAKFEQVCEVANTYLDGIDRSRKEVDDASMALINHLGA